ncbi:MgtC/SapB family protein [Mesoterricola silvestris]|uniref:DUF4010 domain-containing protein n=1 Tax=Mesoterricola silvestris TaxID=2927979 RepID=A0AA48KA69_9BACT|nr:DUF4010 domain-containing protein [Mesoterricola silvestris]BDU73805.1 hypothetical protein METEAL_29790 [Mesoterricola silvestris]
MIPPLVASFLLTLAASFLIGIGLRDYYEGEGKFDTFGTVRTFVFFGMLGFLLYQMPTVGPYVFTMGLAAIVPFLLVYYNNKVRQKKSPGLIGVLIALLTYTLGPITLLQPHWYVVLIAVSILFVLHSKGRIRKFTDRLETGEVVTACKFLAIAGVVLPLIPAVMPATGHLGRLFAVLPLTPRQVWMAVVVTTTISYFGYVLQTYLYPRRGLLLTGLLGGVYSSTVAVLVLAKRSRQQPGRERQAATAILLAVAMMYLRVLVLVAIFRTRDALKVAPALLVLAILSAAYGLWINRDMAPDPTPAALPEEGGIPAAPEPGEEALHRNPLEINSALFFAFMFVTVSFATKYALIFFKEMGLRAMSFIVGCSDITPFVVTVLQGNLGIGSGQILQAIIIATASNNVLKVFYTYLFGTRRTANLAATGMAGLIVLSLAYALIGL